LGLGRGENEGKGKGRKKTRKRIREEEKKVGGGVSPWKKRPYAADTERKGKLGGKSIHEEAH